MNRFLKTLKQKTIVKFKKFPEINIAIDNILQAKNFEDFDNAVTAPLFGFKNAQDYWKQCSSKPYINHIKKPTLLLNALDDTFLSFSCHPYEEANNNPSFYFEPSKYGGHVGFNTSFKQRKNVWSENRILAFIQDKIL
jgi:predicted alpha/beta-fold hydrolase